MLNKAILMGRLTADPELRATASGTPVCAFTLAVNRKISADGQTQADFIEIVAWNKTAGFVSRYFSKGQQVAVSGRIQTRLWEDKQGSKRKSVEVIAEEVYFAEGKKDRQAKAEPSAGGFSPYVGADDDIPF